MPTNRIVSNTLRDKLEKGAAGAEVTSNANSKSKFDEVPDDKPIEYKKPKKQRKAITVALTVKEYNALVISCTNNGVNLTALIKNALIKAGYIPEERNIKS
jgi:hypothetical protein